MPIFETYFVNDFMFCFAAALQRLLCIDCLAATTAATTTSATTTSATTALQKFALCTNGTDECETKCVFGYSTLSFIAVTGELLSYFFLSCFKINSFVIFLLQELRVFFFYRLRH